MRNSSKIKEASAKVFSKLFSMDAEELNNKLIQREIGPISQAFIASSESSWDRYHWSGGCSSANLTFQNLQLKQVCQTEGWKIPVYSCLKIWSSTMTSDLSCSSYNVEGEEESWLIAA